MFEQVHQIFARLIKQLKNYGAAFCPRVLMGLFATRVLPIEGCSCLCEERRQGKENKVQDQRQNNPRPNIGLFEEKLFNHSFVLFFIDANSKMPRFFLEHKITVIPNR